MKKKLLGLTALLLVAAAAVSCGEEAKKPEDTKGADTKEKTSETEAQTEEKVDYLASIGTLSDLDFAGKTINIDISVNEEEWNTSSVYVMGGEEDSPIDINSLVYHRNIDIAEALNVKVNWIPSDLPWRDVEGYIKKQIDSGDNETHLYINDRLAMIKLMTRGYLLNTLDIDKDLSYFDFSTDGWNTEYMDTLAVLPGKRYILAGDYFIDSFRSSHVLYFNKRLMSEKFEGPDELFDLVDEGKWTFEKYVDYAKNCYYDLNGDGVRDLEDLYGVRADYLWSSLFYSVTDCHCVSWDEEGMPYLDISVERTSKLADYMIDLFKSPGYTDIESSGVTRRFFSEDKLLFTSWMKIADMESPEFRAMEGIGIIPYPKLDESQKNYRSLSHNTCEVGAIPTSVNENDLDAVSAYIQAMTQYSAKYVMLLYYETVLKIKYAQDDKSARMIDIIHDGISSPFEYAYNDYVGNEGNLLLQNSMQNLTNTVASDAESRRSATEKALGRLMSALEELE